ncbi:hypothetical protein LP090_01975 [Moraxella bovis]|uniref:hypothetical protein n=1 Tax=Moraxella bovis TaxID=476 RepID=UPI002225E7D0|nr:hypothetical protein [Moraxella bovis]UYZ68185.1 hypothetical protein LP122_10565 [Moraxella bovis]UYZ70568.1 hypothetical protein LP089_10715 [Moraxella bovis]UYZ73512.1 hypothetical protein LP105_01960 [Moraxella bovis]UZA13870.1 hypothetical protein LP102_10780 [Moraxella bovis]UZA27778.1 hypothetical protein LP119_01990 [Moraxella bovis]
MGGCTYWGNFCLTYDRPNNDEWLRTTVHELGHSLGLEHPFQDDISNLLFEKAYTDNLMDYNSGIALNKYQWDIIYNDGNIIAK